MILKQVVNDIQPNNADTHAIAQIRENDSKIDSRPTSVRLYQYIDILRGIAILAVVALHTSQHVMGLRLFTRAAFYLGELGVQLFFVASAITLCPSSSQRSDSNDLVF